jgi:hypothetical protein
MPNTLGSDTNESYETAMSHQHTSYHESNGLGHTTRNVQHAPPSAAHCRAVAAWFAVWRALTPGQQGAWRALSKQQQDQTKGLSAADFATVMECQS